jgi:hypothetical protein
MKNFGKAIFVSVILILMSGCTGYGVTFQSAPNDSLSNCYPALIGNWRLIEGKRNAPTTNDQDFLSISEDCSNMYSVTFKVEAGKRTIKVDDLKNNKDQKIQFSDGEDFDYVVVTPKETSFEINPEIKLPSGKIIYQINPGKDGVILRSVDLDKTIQLVLARKINGQIYVDRDNPVGNQAANVYVRGDAKQITTYLNTQDMYSNDRLLLISATTAETKSLQKAIKRYETDKKAK